MSSVSRIKEQRRTIVDRHIEADNVRGFTQALTTLAPLAALWYAAALSAGVSYWLTAAVTLPMSLFVMRAFLLMHDCGHGSLFRTARLNKAFGFIFGVVWGMPQYVWSQHHAFHTSGRSIMPFTMRPTATGRNTADPWPSCRSRNMPP